ncbi:hypothetical protein BN2476_670077 [Paraburkholderia piptadeniae]|uniref:Uncharacterized protein n=1 Tax=Paraburkholderia piptadeniae TaxID=1701573 RepID=A0A1N7SNK2_9BURK|nr:hypothetical protein [Paraburkholderia piptadeniae]SIT49032.1 hypothetical protein BN2476_670077 [Paraburkholderia piptadeniae]
METLGGASYAQTWLEQRMIGRVRIDYLPGCISPDEVEAALARISPAGANAFAHEAL